MHLKLLLIFRLASSNISGTYLFKVSIDKSLTHFFTFTIDHLGCDIVTLSTPVATVTTISPTLSNAVGNDLCAIYTVFSLFATTATT